MTKDEGPSEGEKRWSLHGICVSMTIVRRATPKYPGHHTSLSPSHGPWHWSIRHSCFVIPSSLLIPSFVISASTVAATTLPGGSNVGASLNFGYTYDALVGGCRLPVLSSQLPVDQAAERTDQPPQFRSRQPLTFGHTEPSKHPHKGRSHPQKLTTDNRQLTTVSTLTGCLTHDHHGNQYSWDIDNRLSAKTHDSQALGTADYKYDVLGRRVAKDSGGGSWGKTVTLWWNMREVADYETTGTTPAPIHHYLNLPRHNDRVARTVQVGSSEQVQYYHKNYLDHVYAITDEDGKALEYIRYSAFGIATFYDFTGLKVANSPTGNQFLWNAKRLDPQLGWYLYHYRHYSPELGRWPSRDPIEEDGGVNLYGFVGNGPLSAWDWLGRLIIVIGPNQHPPGLNHPANEYERELNRERMRPNPFIENVDYFPPITENALDDELAKVDSEGKVTQACDATQLNEAREAKKQVLRAALEWNSTSPEWKANDNECGDQAQSFMIAIRGPVNWERNAARNRGEEDKFNRLFRENGFPYWSVMEVGGINPANRRRYRQHIVNAVMAMEKAKDCCMDDFVIDVFKWRDDCRHWDPAIRFGPLSEWDHHFPRDLPEQPRPRGTPRAN